MDLFKSIPLNQLPGTPWAEILRPSSLDEVCGQPEILKEFKKFASQNFLPSLILVGPPGCGKTTLAHCLSQEHRYFFESLNAVDTGAKDLKQKGELARARRQENAQTTVMFIDEIHRLNKAQQDVLLSFIERGDLILIGATTENPSYEINRALISRCRIFRLRSLSTEELHAVLVRAQSKLQNHISEAELMVFKQLTDENLELIVHHCDGDARKLLVALELVVKSLASGLESAISSDQIKNLLGQSAVHYDKNSQLHYDCISAFIKSIRGSDPDAALFWFARMLEGGEDPSFIARRLIILASEDIGNADPRALPLAVSAAQAVEMIGLPEARICLAQVITYLSSAPKSNRSYLAINKAIEMVQAHGSAQVPSSLQSAGGRSADYLYPHDYPKSWVEQSYWPQNIKPAVFYQPSNIGFEKNIQEYLNWLRSK
jgi:putative ATPase